MIIHKSETKEISKSTLARLPMYLTYLRSILPNGPENISSTAIASALGLGDVQVRKDLASVSDQGKPKVGYNIADLIDTLEEFLGYKDVSDAVVVGTGKLGRALLDYKGFEDYGLNIVAGFDISEDILGTTDSGKKIYNLSRFDELLSHLKIRIGIITVPAESAQYVCDLMIKNGIMAILNFSPVHLNVPENIIVQNENIAASLAILSNRLSAALRK